MCVGFGKFIKMQALHFLVKSRLDRIICPAARSNQENIIKSRSFRGFQEDGRDEEEGLKRNVEIES